MGTEMSELKFPRNDQQAAADNEAVYIEVVERAPVLAGMLNFRNFSIQWPEYWVFCL